MVELRHWRLYPTASQMAQLRECCDACRRVDEVTFKQCQIAYELTGTVAPLALQRAQLRELRSEQYFLRQTPMRALQEALSGAHARFLGEAEQSTDEEGEYFTLGQHIKTREVEASPKWKELQLPLIGWVRYDDVPALESEIRNVKVQQKTLGVYTISFLAKTTPSANKEEDTSLSNVNVFKLAPRITPRKVLVGALSAVCLMSVSSGIVFASAQQAEAGTAQAPLQTAGKVAPMKRDSSLPTPPPTT